MAASTCTVYRVSTVKRGEVTHVAVDGGMGDNLEVSLTGQRFEATIVNRVGGGEAVTVVGRHCESGNQLADRVPLRDPAVGDLLAVPVAGAYCYTMSNQYNGARRVPVVFVAPGWPGWWFAATPGTTCWSATWTEDGQKTAKIGQPISVSHLAGSAESCASRR
ncbi:MAG: diaminopimelate decarboxylase [Mycobacterium sp.]|nr:diaminopimelate decarboxylase [Mycobacterium sp.]